MGKLSEDRRIHPRIGIKYQVEVAKTITAKASDLSEAGLCFSTPETISSPTMTLKINFPNEKEGFKSTARLVWKRDIEDGSFSYGVEFVDLNETQKASLREELIKAQTAELIEGIKSPEVRQQVSHFFFEDVLSYTNEMVKLIQSATNTKEYSLEIEKKFDQINSQILLKGYCLEELLADKKIMQQIKDSFRKLVGVWVYKSLIVRRGFEKPRGYAGDYEMLEIVYNDKPLSRGLGKYFDNNFLKSPYAVAVRIRKDRLREILQEYIDSAKAEKVRILDIACGSSREIRELLLRTKTKNEVIITCLDWDNEALKFSQDALLPNKPKNINLKFVQEDVMNLTKNGKAEEGCGRQNLIYSIGLIDYIPDRMLKKLIQAWYQLLLPGGKLILTHKNREKTFPPLPPDWFCDWKFVPRNREEAIKLFYDCGMPGFSLSWESDEFGYIYYFTITKP